MSSVNVIEIIKRVLENLSNDWLELTTHRLDIYNEKRAKIDFLDHFENLLENDEINKESLAALPTAYDYIRLGHPLSSILEWALAKLNGVAAEQVIAFSSTIMPMLAVLRKNLFEKRDTRIVYSGSLPENFDPSTLKEVYGYCFELAKMEDYNSLPDFDGRTILISQGNDLKNINLSPNIDFLVSTQKGLGSIILVNGEENASYISEIQHVRRRESIAMTPANCLIALRELIGEPTQTPERNKANYESLLETIADITDTSGAFLGSSGLSVQYAIMMGLIDEANKKHPGKPIRFIVPPNCYGGTNDQARRVAATLDHVEILDLPVDGENDMVKSIDRILDQVAEEESVPYIIVEIPTNPRVEVPDREALISVLTKLRKTSEGIPAIDPVFIVDQTFCPNVQFCSEDGILASVQTISYVSGSKFPSGGKCTAGYCVSNKKGEDLLPSIGKHLHLCDNEATPLQVDILAEKMPSMIQRIKDAYKNTREFVGFIREVLPKARINFVSDDLAEAGFTPSVFSLDLPTKGDTHEEREAYKRELNHRLIKQMITEIPGESKYCVSYGQLKGCYWTIPATSTQGTTKEEDKDYIARVALSPQIDLEQHKRVFSKFIETM